MASRGVEILATDLMEDRLDQDWRATQQHAANRDALFHEKLIDRASFDRLVSFQPADMNDLSPLSDEYDFLWSSCAFEHLGTLEKGLDFVVNAMRLLKPGGVAVHTTEYNVASNDETLESGPGCIYRRRDIDDLDYRLRRISCGLEAVDFDAGSHPYDLLYDRPPYWQKGRVHLKLELQGHICTSVLLVACKG